MKSLVFTLALWAGTASVAAEPPNAVVHVDFSNPGLIPAQWSLEVHPNGTAHFRTQRGTAPRESVGGIEPPNLDEDVQLSARFAQHVFDVAERKRHFQEECESHMKVAFQGLKRLSYSGPSGQGSCEFNYSKDAEIGALGDSFVSVATTLIEGARLEKLLQHDRLGLDKEMEVLTQMAADGRAQQMIAIRDILQRLADDDAVLERVRKRARVLLERADD